MKHFAICKTNDGEFETVDLYGIKAIDKYRTIIEKAVNQIQRDNANRKPNKRISLFLFLAEHDNGYGPTDHIRWSKEMYVMASNFKGAVFDFNRPEHGIDFD